MGATAEAKVLLDETLKHIQVLEREIRRTKADVLLAERITPDTIPSNMDVYDVVFALIAGIIGSVVSTSEELRAFLANIHDRPNDSFLGTLLEHSGDRIDTNIDGQFLNRVGGNAEVPYHRVLFGHDPLSLGPDNPFYLLVKQHGLIRGILQVFRHFIGDTFSKQGLPLPGHSFLDVIGSGPMGEATFSNRLITWSKQLSQGAGPRELGVGHPQIYQHLFTIHMQDIVSSGLAWALVTAYLSARNVADPVRKSQTRIIAYTASFLGHAVVGMVRTGGVPYIHWPMFGMVVRQIFELLRLSYDDIQRLERQTARLVETNLQLEAKVFATGRRLPSLDSGASYITDLIQGQDNFNRMTDLFEEGV